MSAVARDVSEVVLTPQELVWGHRPLSTLQIGAESFASRGGGLNRYFHDLLSFLPATGIRCSGLVVGSGQDNGGGATRTFAPMDAPLIKRWMAERSAVATELASQHVDLIVAHFALYAMPILKWVSPSLPLVVHFHGPWAEEARQEGGTWLGCALKRMCEGRVVSRAARLIVLSEAFGRILSDDFHVLGDRVRIVPGGIRCERFELEESRSEARAALGWPAGRRIILAVRRLVSRVGLENLIDAMVEVRKVVPDVLLMIAGSGRMREALEARIAEQGLRNHVRLLGFVPDTDLPRSYRAAELSVVPSIALEGFGLTAAESLASGTPVLVTPVGGLPEVVAGLPGSLFPSAEPAAMAATLIERLRNPSILADSKTCRRYARQHFDWPVIANRVANVYREVVA